MQMWPAKPVTRTQLIKHSIILLGASMVFILWGLLQLDQVIADFFKQPQYELIYKYSREVTNVGYSIHYFILALVGWAVAKYLNQYIKLLNTNPRLTNSIQQWSVFVFKSLICIGLFVQVLKFIFGRQRPHITEDFQNTIFVPFSTHWHFHSFPSGHTQVLLTMATIGSMIWPKQRVYFFILALLLAFTRVVIHQHFFSDFVAGAFVGYILTLWIYFYRPPNV
jgi:membrane-associated phospholipid phosphatase